MDNPGVYLAVLGQPCYAKFIAVPNYTYLKLKMPGPHGIITIGVDLQWELRCCNGRVSNPGTSTHPNDNNNRGRVRGKHRGATSMSQDRT